MDDVLAGQFIASGPYMKGAATSMKIALHELRDDNAHFPTRAVYHGLESTVRYRFCLYGGIMRVMALSQSS